jgi:single-strand DNA-binding protein
MAERANSYTKGSRVYVEGRIQTRTFEGRDGQPRHVIEVVATELQMLSPRQPREFGDQPMARVPAAAGAGPLSDENLDDVPF